MLQSNKCYKVLKEQSIKYILQSTKYYKLLNVTKNLKFWSIKFDKLFNQKVYKQSFIDVTEYQLLQSTKCYKVLNVIKYSM